MEKRRVIVLACLAMILCLLLGIGTGQAETDVISVDTKYLKEIDLSAKNWCSLDVTREYFVLAMILDGMDSWSSKCERIVAEAILYDTLYVVEDGNSVNAFVFGSDDIMIFRYNTLTGIGSYSTTYVRGVAVSSEKYMNALAQQGTFPNSYYKVDGNNVMKRIEDYLE